MIDFTNSHLIVLLLVLHRRALYWDCGHHGELGTMYRPDPFPGRMIVKPNTHRRRRRDETVESRRVGVVYTNSQLVGDSFVASSV